MIRYYVCTKENTESIREATQTKSEEEERKETPRIYSGSAKNGLHPL